MTANSFSGVPCGANLSSLGTPGGGTNRDAFTRFPRTTDDDAPIGLRWCARGLFVIIGLFYISFVAFGVRRGQNDLS